MKKFKSRLVSTSKKILKPFLPPILINLVKAIKNGCGYKHIYKNNFNILLEIEKSGAKFRKGSTDELVFNQVYSGFCGLYPFKDAKIIIDAGANCGFSSIWFAKNFPDAKIFAIEPDFDNFSILSENVKKYSNIIPLNLALTNQEGTVTIVDRGTGEWGYSVADDSITTLKIRNQIESTSIQSIMEKFSFSRIDILKVDVEGSETKIFDTSSVNWIEQCRVITVEPHDYIAPNASRSIFYSIMKFPQFTCRAQGELFVFINQSLK